MKRALNRAFDPPAPIVSVLVRPPGGPDERSLEGKIDTGADVCGVPERVVLELDLPPVRTVRASGFAGGLEEVVLFRIDLELDGMTFRRVEALATRRPYVIVGRNVLRELVLRIDGPRERLEIRRARR